MADANFVIVYGALRSGTTLLRLMLDQHPGLNCPGETDFLFDYLSQDASGAWQLDRDSMQRERIFQASGVECPPDVPPKAAVEEMIAQLHQTSPDATLILMIHRGLDRALVLFPDARVLHMLRDPRDVARSSIGMGWAGTVYHGVCHWIDTEQEWAMSEKEMATTQVVTLRYEALIRAPEAELTRITEFMGQTYMPDMLSYHESSSYSAPNPKLIEQWRRKLTPYEVGLVEARIGGLLDAAGYTPSGHPLRRPAGFEAIRLAVTNKRAIWKERTRRFGLLDPILVGLARRLGLPHLGHGAQARINKKALAYLD